MIKSFAINCDDFFDEIYNSNYCSGEILFLFGTRIYIPNNIDLPILLKCNYNDLLFYLKKVEIIDDDAVYIGISESNRVVLYIPIQFPVCYEKLFSDIKEIIGDYVGRAINDETMHILYYELVVLLTSYGLYDIKFHLEKTLENKIVIKPINNYSVKFFEKLNSYIV